MKDIYGDEIIPTEEYTNAITKISCRCKSYGHTFSITPNMLLSKKRGCPICSVKRAREASRITLEEYTEKLHKIRPTMDVIGEFNGTKSGVDLICHKCNNIWHLNSAFQGVSTQKEQGCPFCEDRATKSGYNTLGDKRPYLLNYLENKDDAFKVSELTNEKLNWKCPDCGLTFSRSVNTIVHNGFNCPRCGDTISLPNKMIRSILEFYSNELECLEFEYGNEEILGKQKLDAYFEYKGVKYGVEMQGK